MQGFKGIRISFKIFMKKKHMLSTAELLGWSVGSRFTVPDESSGKPGNIFMFPFNILQLVYLLN